VGVVIGVDWKSPFKTFVDLIGYEIEKIESTRPLIMIIFKEWDFIKEIFGNR
jgi:hypothetical protein